VLSICDWGKRDPWNWAPGMSTMWRDSTDIVYWGQQPSMTDVLANFDAAQHPEAQSAGHYNDPDMLVVGMPGFTAAQNRTHMSLWAISGAPLIAGNNLTTMTTETKNILADKEVVAIDQDSLGRQGVKVAEDQAGRQVYSKVLAGDGRRAVVALNRTDSAADITVRFADLGLADTAAVRDVWAAADRGTTTTSYTVNVPAHEAVLLTVTGTDEPGTGTRVGEIVGKQSDRCLDIDNSSTTNGTQAQLWDCNGQDNQRWTYAGGTLASYGGAKCLDAYHQGTTAGTQVVIWDCNGQANQQWSVNSDGTIRGVQSGLCLDASGSGTGNGTKIILWSCGSGDNQLWSMH
jgi:Ricin-type beta-trefoil lectin domain/Alpha galactosidase A/Alpha galactosidase C-terminal beta sandwich domain